MADQPAPACVAVGYQEVCVDADVSIVATATAQTPIVTCLTRPEINPIGTITCTVPVPPIPCGFSVQVTLCVEVPVDFSATAEATVTSQVCGPASGTACEPIPPPPVAGRASRVVR